MKRVKIKYLGSKKMPIYGGWDPGTNEPVTVAKGEIVEVSAVKARQLQADFGLLWRVIPDAEVGAVVETIRAKVKSTSRPRKKAARKGKA